MKKKISILLTSALMLTLMVVNAEGRPAYKGIVDGLEAKTDAEKQAQASVKADKCNSCHIKGKSKKMRSEYGLKMHKALGGKEFKYDKDLFKKADGKYSAEAVKLVQDAINKASAKK